MEKKTKKSPPIIQSDHVNGNKNDDVEVYNDYVEDYFNVQTMKKHPATQRFISKLAFDLKEFADLPNTLRMKDFYNAKGISMQTFYRWKDKFEDLGAAFEYANNRFGAKREDGALSNQMNAQVVLRTIGHYDHIYKDEQVFIEKLKAENVQADVKLIIEPFKMPETPEEVALKINMHTKSNYEANHYKKYNKDER